MAGSPTMKIGLIPLDERPANTRYPAMVAAVAGAEVVVPPPAALSRRRNPADHSILAAWLTATAPALDGLIVSVEMLGYGGLIASRTSADPVAAVLGRLEILRALKAANPRLPIYGFNVISRVSNADDAVEEPGYWAAYGERLYALSQLLDRRGRGQDVTEELTRLEAVIPAEHRHDFLARRLRNHTVNLAALGLLDQGLLDLLVLSSDDTSPFGLPSREKAWLAGWGELLNAERKAQSVKRESDSEPSATAQETVVHSALYTPRLLMYPGADEVGCALVARMLNQRAGVNPTVAVSYAPAEAAANVAAYEDGPISLTVERQVVAAGGRLMAGEADVWLGVNAPLARRAEWEAVHAGAERETRLAALTALVAAAEERLARGQMVAIADVAYPNGADPALIELMAEGLNLGGLAAYGAWNTAGNTVGAAVAQAFAALLSESEAGRAAQERLLLHRLVEDWGYQHLVRAAVRGWLRDTTDSHDPQTPEAIDQTCRRIEAGLNEAIERLPSFAGRYRIAPGSVQLPWGRTFEVDFELERQGAN